ncbi:hypothetical protein [Leptospira noguchii]|uniref:hypothetical protein n=1 Tax=Leptospira noguchii TaxID=28182 RepID=UPI0012DA540F|nr:hypothetical protein [Leptospira noguchii]UOG58985.1 hypothetical protein MAL07_09030 [Leptospira noguchii]
MLSSILILKFYSTCGVGYDSPWVVRETQRLTSMVVRGNSASHSPNSAKRFLRKRFRSFEETQRLTSMVVRRVAF